MRRGVLPAPDGRPPRLPDLRDVAVGGRSGSGVRGPARVRGRGAHRDRRAGDRVRGQRPPGRASAHVDGARRRLRRRGPRGGLPAGRPHQAARMGRRRAAVRVEDRAWGARGDARGAHRPPGAVDRGARAEPRPDRWRGPPVVGTRPFPHRSRAGPGRPAGESRGGAAAGPQRHRRVPPRGRPSVPRSARPPAGDAASRDDPRGRRSAGGGAGPSVDRRRSGPPGGRHPPRAPGGVRAARRHGADGPPEAGAARPGAPGPAGRRSRRSVADIASHWGFTHLGRFAAAYRERYGCVPSETLRS